MPIVRANPNEFLLVGRRGKLENRGSAVRAMLLPGTIYVLIPATKQEATFEFTQETKDGIPLRFKGIVIYRITDPVTAARSFNFTQRDARLEISSLIAHVCLGELRHAVSHMTMVECIEQRKTTLTGVVEAALQAAIEGRDGRPSEWGIAVEVAQVAQVFIVDMKLREQLEAEVRNQIKLQADQSTIHTEQETALAEMAAANLVAEKKLAGDRDDLRRAEELELARVARDRRMLAEKLATDEQAFELEQQRVHSQSALEEYRVNTEAPVRLLKATREREVLAEELAARQIHNQVTALDVEADMLLPRAQHELRREMLPIEQAPAIVESAARVLNGTNLSIYGEGGQLIGEIAPLLDLIARAVRQATQPGDGQARADSE